MKKCWLYYGMETPSLEVSQDIQDTLLVMQDYHPLSQSGTLQEFFPHCRRHLYLNCAYVYPAEAQAFGLDIGHLPINPHLRAYLLDLKDPATRRFLEDKALRLLDIEGVQGLFLDDVDHWTKDTELRALFCDLIKEIRLGAPREPGFSINRGACFWHRLPNLEAVILENVYPERANTSDPFERQWLANLVKLNLSYLQSLPQEVPVFGLRYGKVQEEIQDSPLYRELKERLTDTLVFENKELAEWPNFYQ